jgi:transposase InsO family protein
MSFSMDHRWDPDPRQIQKEVTAIQQRLVRPRPEIATGAEACFTAWPTPQDEEVTDVWDPSKVVRLSENELFEIRKFPGYVSVEDKVRLIRTLHAAYACRLKGQNMMRLLLLWFPGLDFGKQLVTDVVKSCQQCQLQRKLAPTSSVGWIEIPRRPWQTVSVDHFQYRNHTGGIFKYILTVKDDFSKQVVFVPVRSKNIKETWVALDVVFMTTGKPETIRADNAFRSHEFTRWAALRDYYLFYSPPYRPRANGMVERVHNDINRLMPLVLEALCLEPAEWVLAISEVARIINQTPNLTHGYPPEMVCKGYLTDEVFLYTRTEKLRLTEMWEKIHTRLTSQKRAYAKPHSPAGPGIPQGTRCWLKVPGREIEQVEILIDLGSTVLCNKLSLPQGHRYRCLVIHKEFLRVKTVEAQENIDQVGVSLTWGSRE